MRYAIIKDNIVINVIELEPKNLCDRAPGHSASCTLWHCPSGHSITEAGEHSRPGPQGRAAGPGDLVKRVGAARTAYFEPAPTPASALAPGPEAAHNAAIAAQRAADLAAVQAVLPAGAAAALARLLKGS